MLEGGSVKIKLGLAVLVLLQLVFHAECQKGNRLMGLIKGKNRSTQNIRHTNKWKIPRKLAGKMDQYVKRPGDVLLVPLVPNKSENNPHSKRVKSRQSKIKSLKRSQKNRMLTRQRSSTVKKSV